MNDRVAQLVEIMLDKSAREDERHDAAMYLFEYDDPTVLKAFFQLGSDENELQLLLEAAGEGVGEIWSRKNIFDLSKLQALSDITQDVVLDIIRSKNPGLLK